ncbi:uncharacterized protein K02A2.6-like [Poecilia formosa]|uniref:uncharacterized protein K02A2.6-like n=1 Tax=Poecilia formosa TaxID=48698 RepID=UPI0007B8C3A0|nr:PREDICTED: uncharacterized protein K02A2.6-like [Poecilia formosa]
MEGWPTVTDDSLKAYHNKRNELSTEMGCVLWGTRVIIPSKMRKAVLNEIHSGHQGIVKSKALARKYVWWPNLDHDLEQVCKTCETCQMDQKMPQHVPLHPWEFPGESWKRLHIDFAGPFLDSMFMIVVDSYSKWLEVFRMPHITSQATVTKLKRLFASYGLPEQIVTDNATTFTSAEFQTFVTQNGILHTTSAPGHPATNSLAESLQATHATLRTDFHCFCCSTVLHQIVQRVSLQQNCSCTDTFVPDWISSNLTPRSLFAGNSIGRKLNMTSQLWTVPFLWMMLCIFATLGEEFTSGYLDRF